MLNEKHDTIKKSKATNLAESLSLATEKKRTDLLFLFTKKRQRRITDAHEVNRNKETSEAKSTTVTTFRVFLSLSHIIFPILAIELVCTRELTILTNFFLCWILSFVHFFLLFYF